MYVTREGVVYVCNKERDGVCVCNKRWYMVMVYGVCVCSKGRDGVCV